MEDKETTCKQLADLMEFWKKQHEIESEKERNRLEKFAFDGAIGIDGEWDNANPKVLYVALAPNWEKDEYRECFWIQKVVYGNADDSGSRILKWLFREQCKIENYETSDKDIDYRIVKKAAFINLSKRGCYDGNYERCVKQYLQNENYWANTVKQLKYLDPDIIVCYNQKVRKYINKLLEEAHIQHEVLVHTYRE